MAVRNESSAVPIAARAPSTIARFALSVFWKNGRNRSDLAHTKTLVLIDGAGRIRGAYAGSLQLDIERLGKDIHAVLNENYELQIFR